MIADQIEGERNRETRRPVTMTRRGSLLREHGLPSHFVRLEPSYAKHLLILSDCAGVSIGTQQRANEHCLNLFLAFPLRVFPANRCEIIFSDIGNGRFSWLE